MLKLWNKLRPINWIFCLAVVAAAQMGIAQPYEGDLEIYSGSVSTGSGNNQPNLVFIADTSGSMDDYVAVEYQLTKDSYDPVFDYGGDGAAADDDYIYVYDDIETYSGVSITPAQNKCESLTNTYTNSPNFPLYTDKVLQWKPIESEVLVSEEVVCETTSTSVSSSSIDLASESIAGNWDEVFFDPSTTFDQDDFVSGSEIRLTVTTSGSRNVRGGLYAYQTDSAGNQTNNWDDLCYKGTWDKGETETATCEVDDIPYTYYVIRVWFDRKGGGGSASISGSMTYNVNAPTTTTQVDPGCTPADAVYTSAVTDGEWSGTLETTSDSDYILECADDAGVHGIDGVSSDTEAAFCGSATCTSPRYVSSAGIDWTSAGLSDKYFYSGNYHDYLNYTPPTPDTLYDSRATWDVNDRGDGPYGDWDTANGRSVESFCNLLDDYERIASDRNDSDTWSAYISHPPTNPQVYVYDSNEGTDFIYVCKQKQQTMIDAMTNMVTSLSNINVGLMRFNDSSSEGGSVSFSVRDIDDYMTPGDSNTASVRSELLSEISSLPANSSTPLTETLFEAYRYFSGGNDFLATGLTDADAYDTDPEYQSPIQNSCQSNNIIYITDGEPTSDTNHISTIENLTGECYSSSVDSGRDEDPDNSCLDDLAEVMADQDIHDSDGKSVVNTYTVGFAIDLDLLEETAEKGNGEYFTAESYDDLITAFQEILIQISISEPSTLVAPAVSVNAFNELRHRNQIYYATFTPAFNPAWEGNVKRYALAGDGVIYGQAGESSPVIGDDGFFKADAQSFWSDFPDGSIVEQGGFREQLTNTRKVYIDGSVLQTPSTGLTELTSSSVLDPSGLGAADAAEAAELRDWLLGVDVDDYDDDTFYNDAHRYAADSLHSRPFVITYSGTSEADAKDILFLTTNMGEIRAVDARSTYGTELWSYMLPEFMGNVKTYRDNSSSLRHWNAYGLDGEASVWTEEANGSSSTNFNIGTAYMFQGMRRGGKDYFAWDISNADLEDPAADPISQMWKITGGTGAFADLSFSWSQMLRTKLRWGCSDAYENTGCTTKDVLVFGGGYDGVYDGSSSTFNNSDTVDGDAIFIVDAMSGALLWSAGNHNAHDVYQDPQGNTLPMYDSIPSDLSPVDIDRDGDMDMLFAIDISGKIFRFDFDQTASGSSSAPGTAYATGGLIANLRDGSNTRRFYNGLDVSFLAPPGESPYFTIAVGSGYRANPKDEESWANNFYVVVDENLIGPAIDDKNTEATEDDEITYKYKTTEDESGNITARAVISHSDLYAVTTTAYEKGTNGDYGFYRAFDASIYEKVLQESSTFDGDIFISTYSPISSSTTSTCGAAEIGTGRIYRLNLETGLSTLSDNGDGIEIEVPGIPTEFTWLILDEGLTLCTGTICTSTAKTDPNDTPEDDDDSLDFNTLDENKVPPDGDIGTAVRTYWFEQ